MAKKVASNEEILKEILLRLPVKPLLRCKCVSKRWRALISNPHFCHSHTLRQYQNATRPFPSAILLGTTTPSRCPVIPLKCSESDSASNFRYVKVPRMNIRIMQSCNGLLLLEGRPLKTPNNPLKTRYFIYNPTTSQYVAINFPTLQFKTSVLSLALSFNPLKSPHYKIISVRFRDCSSFSAMMSYTISTISQHVNAEYVVNVYSSETGSWTDRGVSFTCPPIPSSPVYCDGALYWYIDATNSKYFDVENQCFKRFPLPIGIRDKKVDKYLGESSGRLHSVVQSLLNFEVEIFELNEDRSGWSVRFRVNLHPMLVACPYLNISASSVGIRLTYIYCVVRQENEVGSMLVFSVAGKFIAYNLVESTFKELSSFSPFLNAGSHCDVFNYHENLSWIGPSNAR